MPLHLFAPPREVLVVGAKVGGLPVRDRDEHLGQQQGGQELVGLPAGGRGQQVGLHLVGRGELDGGRGRGTRGGEAGRGGGLRLRLGGGDLVGPVERRSLGFGFRLGGRRGLGSRRLHRDAERTSHPGVVVDRRLDRLLGRR